ncbi:MAG TPA: hypothetical protein VKZ97_07110, partial [Flavobacteriaceae bacterium]|nr:hypothetical protein [Flavobacteriaceae bacterium]
MKYQFSLIAIFSILFLGYSQNPLATKDVTAQTKWVDSIYSSMTLEEKVGQLFMVRAFSNKDLKHENTVYSLVSDYHVG